MSSCPAQVEPHNSRIITGQPSLADACRSPYPPAHTKQAQVAELADALASGASALYGHEGSSPFLGISSYPGEHAANTNSSL